MPNEIAAMAPAIAAKANRASRQPKAPIIICPNGAITIVPSEPAAETTPTAQLRRSAGTALDTAPSSTPKPVPATPVPIIRPPPRPRPTAGSAEVAITNRPKA